MRYRHGLVRPDAAQFYSDTYGSMMPDAAALSRLLSYYRSPMFDEDFRRIMLAGGAEAATYRQHMVTKMNEKFASEGYVPTPEDLLVQTLFVEGGLDSDELLKTARDFGQSSVAGNKDDLARS